MGTKIIILLLLLTSSAAASPLVQVDSQGTIMVEVSLLKTPEISFEVNLSTHSGDLRRLDLGALAQVQTNEGIFQGLTWEMTQASSHHPMGRLTVQGSDWRNAQYIILRLEDLGGIDREFRWDLKDPQAQGNGYLAYIPNAGDGTVSIVDTVTLQVVDTIFVGEGEVAHGVAVTPWGELYVGSKDGQYLQVIQGTTGEFIEKISLSFAPHGIDISPTGQEVWVVGQDRVAIIDTKDKVVVQELNFSGRGPSHVDFSPDGEFVYITNLVADSVSVLASSSREEIITVPVGQGPNESRPSQDGQWVYVANWKSNEITVIQVGSWQVHDSISVGEGTHGIAVSNDGRFVYTANRQSNDLGVIDLDTKEVRTIKVGEYANHISVHPLGEELYLTNQRDNELVVLDSRNYEIRARVALGMEPHEIAFGKR